MKPALESREDIVATLSRTHGRSFDDISKADAVKVVRRIAKPEQDSPPVLDVAAFGSSI